MTATAPLPGVLAEVAEVAGRDVAIAFAMALGGTEIHVPGPNYIKTHPDHPLSRLLAREDTVLRIARRIGGGNVYVPMARRACAAHLAGGGMSIEDIATRLGIAVKTARRYAAGS